MRMTHYCKTASGKVMKEIVTKGNKTLLMSTYSASHNIPYLVKLKILTGRENCDHSHMGTLSFSTKGLHLLLLANGDLLYLSICSYIIYLLRQYWNSLETFSSLKLIWGLQTRLVWLLHWEEINRSSQNRRILSQNGLQLFLQCCKKNMFQVLLKDQRRFTSLQIRIVKPPRSPWGCWPIWVAGENIEWPHRFRELLIQI